MMRLYKNDQTYVLHDHATGQQISFPDVPRNALADTKYPLVDTYYQKGNVYIHFPDAGFGSIYNPVENWIIHFSASQIRTAPDHITIHFSDLNKGTTTVFERGADQIQNLAQLIQSPSLTVSRSGTVHELMAMTFKGKVNKYGEPTISAISEKERANIEQERADFERHKEQATSIEDAPTLDEAASQKLAAFDHAAFDAPAPTATPEETHASKARESKKGGGWAGFFKK